MTRPKQFPELHEGEYAVLCVEVETGIVLSTSGTRAVETSEKYRIFSTNEQASECAKALVAANSSWECVVLTHEGTVVSIETKRL
jgi:hypothetical protein